MKKFAEVLSGAIVEYITTIVTDNLATSLILLAVATVLYVTTFVYIPCIGRRVEHHHKHNMAHRSCDIFGTILAIR